MADLPATWNVVSMMPLPAEMARGFFPADVDVNVSVVEPRTEAAAVDACRAADIVIGDYEFHVPISATVIEQMTRCRLIQQPSAGYQQIDVDAAAAHGIPVASVGGANAVAVAEHTIMAALALMKQMVWLDAEVRKGEWPQQSVRARGHFELAGKTWGILGFGRIGREVAQRLRGWDVTVLYYDVVRAEPATEAELGVTYGAVDDLLAASDVLSLHTPLTAETRHLIDGAALERMKPSAYLINVARGEVIDEGALVDALRAREIHAAALDVFVDEPLAPGHPLTTLDNVLLSPHTAGTATEAVGRILGAAQENLHRVVRGEAPLYVVNGVAPRAD